MYELLYTSFAAKEFSESDLVELLEQARDKNKRLNITGMLIYDNREIAQLLEGEESAVKELFATIARDERHVSVNVFYEGPIQQRSFSDWSMAFHRLDLSGQTVSTEDFTAFSPEYPPISQMNTHPNKGRRLFAYLREQLVS